MIIIIVIIIVIITIIIDQRNCIRKPSVFGERVRGLLGLAMTVTMSEELAFL